MLVAVPVSLFRWEFRLLDQEKQEVARVRHRAFEKEGLVSVGGVEHVIAPEGRSGTWVLRAGEERPTARFRMVGGWKRWDVTWGNQAMQLVRRPTLGGIRAEAVRSREVVGFVGTTDYLTRRLRVDLPDDVPVTVQAASVWMLIMLRRRAVASA